VERLVCEARAASALNHPHIVTVYEVVHSCDQVAIAMELVEGDALRRFCGEPQPVMQVIHWGRQIAQALAAAHNRNIVHRDIKPENLMVRPDGYVKVLDFGLARQLAATDESQGNQSQSSIYPPFGDVIKSNASAMLAGTLNYMAPEQTRAEPATSASDVFSLGVVLFEVSTGTHPFSSDSPIDTAHAIASMEPHAPSALNRDIPPAFDSLLLEMLAKDQRERPSALEVARKLSTMEAAVDERQTHRFRWLIGGLAACMLAALALWLMWDRIVSPKEPALIQLTNQTIQDRVTAAAVSPDGTQLAFAGLGGSVHLRRMSNGSDRTLSTLVGFQVERIAWFADGTKLVASGFSLATNVPSVWIVPTTEPPPHMLREHAREASPSPDGKQVAFINQDWSEIWVMGVNAEGPGRIVAGPAGDTFQLAFWSSDGRRINYQRRRGDGSTAYESVSVAAPTVAGALEDVRMSSASALPDGRILFLQSNPPDSGIPDQLWEVKTDLATGRFLRAAHRIANLPHQDQTRMYEMSSTSDGKRVTLLRGPSRGAVFIGDFNPSPPRITHIRRLTLDNFKNFPHAWTADSRAVIFESDRNGGPYDLFKQNLDEQIPTTIVATPYTKMLAQMAPDGRTLLYAAHDDKASGIDFKLMRVPSQGGAPEEVPIGGSLDEFRCALEAGKRCVLRTTVPGESYIYYDLDPIRGKGRELARTKWTPRFLGNWDISPDGTQVAIPDHDSSEARIRVIALEPRPNQPREREINLPAPITIHGLVWAANGQGWFVAVRTTFEYRMLYVYLDGHFCPLGDIQGWAVPSPDGKRIAFWTHTVATNAWLITRGH
jgi:Tol biopolymer transport system component